MANWQSIDELQDIASDLPRFTHALDELSLRLGLNITPLTADHISLRCHQNATAERWRRGFEQCGCIDSLEVRKKPGGHWIIRDLMGLDLVGLASL